VTEQPLVCLADFESEARRTLAPAVWDFIDGGSGDETTRAENLRSFGRYALRPSVLVDVSACDLGLDLLGVPSAVPFALAPTAFHTLLTPEGELATVRAAGRVGAITVVSVMASRPLAEIADAARAPLWFQTYWFRDRGLLEELVGQAEALGFRALVLTVDLPRMGRRRRDLRNGFALPAGVAAANLPGAGLDEARAGSSAAARHTEAVFDPSVTWDDIAWLRSTTTLPLVLKGILTAEDASAAVDVGADAVVVSNHGGRQLDGVLPAAAVLPEVVDAVADRSVVLMDGGVRSGSDVLKALALGARAVLVGRPVLWGLATGGEAGAAAALTILRDEIEDAMALAGRPTLASIDSSLICRAAS
jgi:4-hydroxymandelate oxidase